MTIIVSVNFSVSDSLFVAFASQPFCGRGIPEREYLLQADFWILRITELEMLRSSFGRRIFFISWFGDVIKI